MRRRRGLTIVECLIAMTILSLIVLATCDALVAGHQHIHYADRVDSATRLGRDLLEEIVSRPCHDRANPTHFGPEAGETRSTFNDVDDYQNYSEAAGALADFAGNLYSADDQVFSRSVSVTATSQTIADFGRTFQGLSVVVTVRSQAGQQWQFSRFVPEPAP